MDGMEINDILKALNRMVKKYCTPSRLSYQVSDQKYFERLFAYEFYHQFRKMLDNGEIKFKNENNCALHAEIPKGYQGYFSENKIPDFILHVPNTQNNIAVFEFKMAMRKDDIQKDIDKLTDFGKNPVLRYKYLIEVVIGNKEEKKEIDAFKNIHLKNCPENLVIIYFYTDSWRSEIL